MFESIFGKKNDAAGQWKNGKFVKKQTSSDKKYNDIVKKHEELHERTEKESMMYSRALSTYELYKTDKDVQKAIDSMEIALIKNDTVIWTPRYMHFLIDLYIKNGQNDKAWSYLNSLLSKPKLARAGAVYKDMAWMLKKEKKHADAIECFMMAYVEDARQGEKFFRGGLIQDIGVSVRALKWSSQTQEEIANICEYQISTRKYNIVEMAQQYRQLYERLKG